MMNANNWLPGTGRISKSSALSLLVVAAVFTGSASRAQDQQAAAEAAPELKAAISFAKMMDPNSWAQMMAMSMDPRVWMNPISSCVACHDNEDVARYQQAFGGFVPATMMNPAMWASPDAFNNMMAPAMDAEAAERWQRAVEEKYGLKPGDPLPSMHNWWPWGAVSATPAPIPAQ